MQAFLHAVASSVQQESVFDRACKSNMSCRYVHRWWPKDGELWGAITLVHGFGDHGGRFEGMATSLASYGLAVTAVDLIGHGRSPGRRGVIDSYEQLVDEVDRSVELSKRNWPRVPQFVFGQSMGGNLVINWLLRRSEASKSVLGAILGAPLLKAKSMPKEKYMRAGRWLADLLPNFRVPTPTKAEWLCGQPMAQDAYLRDTLVHRTMSLRLATSLVDSGLWAMENAHRLQVPSLLVHGSEDRLTCPAASEEFAKRAGSQAEFMLIHGCRHELHEEAPREFLFETFASWTKTRCIKAWVFPSNSRSKADLQRNFGHSTVVPHGVSIEGMPQGSYTASGL